MDTITHKISVSDTVGEVSAILNEAARPWCLMTLAHGAGAGVTHTFMSSLAHQLSAGGVNVLRFNFPFIEAKRKRPDFAPVAESTVGAALRFAYELNPTLPLFAAGKSFGGRMSSQYLSRHPNPNVRGIVFFGFPLHVANEPAVTRAEHLRAVHVPLLFLQGTKDALARIDLINQVTDDLPNAVLQTFDGADHSFMRGKKTFIPELTDAALRWLRKH